jgi:hypothetical protein
VAVGLVGCTNDERPDRVLDEIERSELPALRSVAAPLVTALSEYRETYGAYPKNLFELAPRFIAKVPIVSTSDVLGGYEDFNYRTGWPFEPFHLATCERSKSDRGWRRCIWYPATVARDGRVRCDGRYALGVERRIDEWCIQYGTDPPS